MIVSNPFFQQINSKTLESLVAQTKKCLCYAAPSIHVDVAKAMIKRSKIIGKESILIFLDVDENVLRMGYGDIEAIKLLQDAGLYLQHLSGLRNGLIVSDEVGYSYTPTALYLEKEAESDEALNAIRLMPEQIQEVMARLSPATQAIAIALADTPEQKAKIEAFKTETQPQAVSQGSVSRIAEELKAVPPAKFDIARQVRVFQPHFQYVELSLTGAAIQRHKFSIPKSIQNLGTDRELAGRLNTTFDLIDKEASVSSKALDQELRDIRDKLTRSLGKKHGRIVRKAALPRLEQRLDELRKKIDQHRSLIHADLDATLEKSKQQILAYYLHLVTENPPDELFGIFGNPTPAQIEFWLKNELSKSFPNAQDLINEIQLDVHYKDVTFDTLNRDDFLSSIKAAYPEENWDQTYRDFLAAGEAK